MVASTASSSEIKNAFNVRSANARRSSVDAIFSAAVPVPRWFRWWFNAAAACDGRSVPRSSFPGVFWY